VRADRLVAILLMLQRHETVTAAQVAAELEISERTARRDLDALGQAGLPVYATRGRGGGWRLLGGGRTDLSGLSQDEVRALFLLAGPATATPEIRAALRKLVRALPEPMRGPAEAAQQALVVDPTGWGGRAQRDPWDATPFLADVQRAVVEARKVEIGYRDRTQSVTLRTVAPLGLAAKAGRWYLVADTERGRRTFRVDRITTLALLDDPVERPADFDLATAWAEVADRVEDLRAPVAAQGRLRRDLVPLAGWLLGPRLVLGGPIDDDWVGVEVRGPSVRSLAGELAGFGAGLVVDGPSELRTQLAQVGTELVALYGRRR
jgi:predicted DNA-binding transcriptional regulator YafY